MDKAATLICRNVYFANGREFCVLSSEEKVYFEKS